MSLQQKAFKLSNGLTIPAVAYGVGTTWFKFGSPEVNKPLVDAVKYALNHGFSHVDGALAYGTDAEIGAVLASVDRSSIHLTNKYWGTLGEHKSPQPNPYESMKAQLKDLKTDYVDLYLLHHPFFSKDVQGYDLKEAWKFMEQLVDEGLAKSIGVSNFAVGDLKSVLESARIKPVVNQIEFSAYMPNQTPGIVKFCQENNILVEAYSPLAPLFQAEDNGDLTEYTDKVAKKYSKTAGQVMLRWVLQNGILPVTTSKNETRISQLNDLFDFELSSEEFSKITDLGAKHSPHRMYWKEVYGTFDIATKP